MSRKRFVKLLMAKAMSRNEAGRIAERTRTRGQPYAAYIAAMERMLQEIEEEILRGYRRRAMRLRSNVGEFRSGEDCNKEGNSSRFGIRYG